MLLWQSWTGLAWEPTRFRVAGFAPTYRSIGDGDAMPGGEVTIAFRNSRNSSPVRVGKNGVE